MRRLSGAAALIAAVFLLAALVSQVVSSRRNNGAAIMSGGVEARLTPARTVWHKANAVGTGMANADDIIVNKDTVFILAGSSAAPVVAAVDAHSGRTRWESDLITCGYLETDGERLYCVGLTGRTRAGLAALDIRNGQVRWTFEATGSPGRLYELSKPTVINGGVCWICENTVYMLDAASGEEIWRLALEGESCLSRAAAVGDCIYAAGRNGIYCMDAKGGQVRWRMPCRFYTWPGSKPLIASAGSEALFVAAGSRDGRSLIRRIDTRTRQCLWEKLVPRAAHIYADSAHLYVRCQDVLALDAATGNPAWEIKAVGCSPITEYDDMICFVDRSEQGRLVAVSRHTGQEAWQISGLHSCNAFVKIGRRGYLVTDDSEVLALSFDL
jgi:outer membrane protein assembly factor BamB